MPAPARRWHPPVRRSGARVTHVATPRAGSGWRRARPGTARRGSPCRTRRAVHARRSTRRTWVGTRRRASWTWVRPCTAPRPMPMPAPAPIRLTSNASPSTSRNTRPAVPADRAQEPELAQAFVEREQRSVHHAGRADEQREDRPADVRGGDEHEVAVDARRSRSRSAPVASRGSPPRCGGARRRSPTFGRTRTKASVYTPGNVCHAWRSVSGNMPAVSPITFLVEKSPTMRNLALLDLEHVADVDAEVLAPARHPSIISPGPVLARSGRAVGAPVEHGDAELGLFLGRDADLDEERVLGADLAGGDEHPGRGLDARRGADRVDVLLRAARCRARRRPPSATR